MYSFVGDTLTINRIMEIPAADTYTFAHFNGKIEIEKLFIQAGTAVKCAVSAK